MNIFARFHNERGDTLVEVTIALAIMSAVLTSAFLLSEKSAQLGRSSKERSLMVSAAQQQAEALTTYRDRYGWSAFNMQIAATAGSAPFYINPEDPSANPLSSGTTPITGVPSSQLSVTLLSATGTIDTFQINYAADPDGGGPTMQSTIMLELGNTDALLPLVRP